MNKKPFLIYFILALLSLDALAQYKEKEPKNPYYDEDLYHFGFLLGANQMNFMVKPKPYTEMGDSLYGVIPHSNLGFTVGIVSNLRLGNYFDLRFIPVLSFGDRKLEYLIKTDGVNIVPITKTVESALLDFPLEVKWKSQRVNNYRAYLLGGVKYSVDLASNFKKRESSNDPDEYIVKIKQQDFALTLGVGFDFYLNYNKISLEYKTSFGMVNLNVPDGTIYTGGIDRLTSRMAQISITFE